MENVLVNFTGKLEEFIKFATYSSHTDFGLPITKSLEDLKDVLRRIYDFDLIVVLIDKVPSNRMLLNDLILSGEGTPKIVQISKISKYLHYLRNDVGCMERFGKIIYKK